MAIEIRKNLRRYEHPGISFPEPTRTMQSSKDECDINQIMKRFEKTGQLPETIKSDPQYGDFSSLPDFQDSLHIVQKSEDQFSKLSARVRARFENDPAKFLEFAQNPANAQEMVDLGLALKREPAPAPEAPQAVKKVKHTKSSNDE